MQDEEVFNGRATDITPEGALVVQTGRGRKNICRGGCSPFTHGIRSEYRMRLTERARTSG